MGVVGNSSRDFGNLGSPKTIARRMECGRIQPVSRAIGDTWLGSTRSAALAVPSVVTPGEWNYLLNPAHSDFQKILIGAPQPFRPDPGC